MKESKVASQVQYDKAIRIFNKTTENRTIYLCSDIIKSFEQAIDYDTIKKFNDLYEGNFDKPKTLEEVFYKHASVCLEDLDSEEYPPMPNDAMLFDDFRKAVEEHVRLIRTNLEYCNSVVEVK